MTDPAPTPEPKTYPAGLTDLFDRAAAGDRAVLPDLRKAFDDHPELVDRIGDVARVAEQAVLGLAVGDDLAGREAIARHAAATRARLLAESSGELEKLLVDRVVISSIEAMVDDATLAGHVKRQPDSPSARAAQARLDRAHARFLAAARTLATVKKLLRPAVSPLDLASRPVAERAPLTGDRLRRRAAGVAAN